MEEREGGRDGENEGREGGGKEEGASKGRKEVRQGREAREGRKGGREGRKGEREEEGGREGGEGGNDGRRKQVVNIDARNWKFRTLEITFFSFPSLRVVVSLRHVVVGSSFLLVDDIRIDVTNSPLLLVLLLLH